MTFMLTSTTYFVCIRQQLWLFGFCLHCSLLSQLAQPGTPANQRRKYFCIHNAIPRSLDALSSSPSSPALVVSHRVATFRKCINCKTLQVDERVHGTRATGKENGAGARKRERNGRRKCYQSCRHVAILVSKRIANKNGFVCRRLPYTMASSVTDAHTHTHLRRTINERRASRGAHFHTKLFFRRIFFLNGRLPVVFISFSSHRVWCSRVTAAPSISAGNCIGNCVRSVPTNFLCTRIGRVAALDAASFAIR